MAVWQGVKDRQAMATEQERCAEAKRFQQIDHAFHKGDLAALRAAVDDPALVPNGRMLDTIGNCLVYAIYHSLLPFIRTLLEIGADPNLPVDDGFPPLIAALSCATNVQGSASRTDVHDILRLLLSFGADPNQRGINGYTPLHMAVSARDKLRSSFSLTRVLTPNCPRESTIMQRPFKWLMQPACPPLRQRSRVKASRCAVVCGLG